MRPSFRPLLLATALAVATPLIPTPGLAQATQPASTSPKAGSMQAMVEQRIKELHTSLHITAAEEPQWNAFIQVMRDNAKATDALYQERQDKIATMTAPENMQSYAKITQQHAEDMQKLTPAFQTLYASFSDAQKKQADEVFRADAERAHTSRAAAK